MDNTEYGSTTQSARFTE